MVDSLENHTTLYSEPAPSLTEEDLEDTTREVINQIQNIISRSINIDKEMMDSLSSKIKGGDAQKALESIKDDLVPKSFIALKNLFENDLELIDLIKRLDPTQAKQRKFIQNVINIVNLHFLTRNSINLTDKLEALITITIEKSLEDALLFEAEGLSTADKLSTIHFVKTSEQITQEASALDEKLNSYLKSLEAIETKLKDSFTGIKVIPTNLEALISDFKDKLSLDVFFQGIQEEMTPKDFNKVKQSLSEDQDLKTLLNQLTNEKVLLNSNQQGKERDIKRLETTLNIVKKIDDSLSRHLERDELEKLSTQVLKSLNFEELLEQIENNVIPKNFVQIKEDLEADIKPLLGELRSLRGESRGTHQGKEEESKLDDMTSCMSHHIEILVEKLESYLPKSLSKEASSVAQNKLLEELDLEMYLEMLQDEVPPKAFKDLHAKVSSDEEIKKLLYEIKELRSTHNNKKENEITTTKMLELEGQLLKMFNEYKPAKCDKDTWTAAYNIIKEKRDMEEGFTFLKEDIAPSLFRDFKVKIEKDELFAQILLELTSLDEHQQNDMEIEEATQKPQEIVLGFLTPLLSEFKGFSPDLVIKMSEELEKHLNYDEMFQRVSEFVSPKELKEAKQLVISCEELSDFLQKARLERKRQLCFDKSSIEVTNYIIMAIKNTNKKLSSSKAASIAFKIQELLAVYHSISNVLDDFLSPEEAQSFGLTPDQLHTIKEEAKKNTDLANLSTYFEIKNIVRAAFNPTDSSDHEQLQIDFSYRFYESRNLEEAINLIREKKSEHSETIIENIYHDEEFEVLVLDRLKIYPFMDIDPMPTIRKALEEVVKRLNLKVGFDLKVKILDYVQKYGMEKEPHIDFAESQEKESAVKILQEMNKDNSVVEIIQKMRTQIESKIVKEELSRDLEKIIQVSKDKLQVYVDSILAKGLLTTMLEALESELGRKQVEQCLENILPLLKEKEVYRNAKLDEKDLETWHGKLQKANENVSRFLKGNQEDQAIVREILGYAKLKDFDQYTSRAVKHVLDQIRSRNKSSEAKLTSEFNKFTRILFEKNYLMWKALQNILNNDELLESNLKDMLQNTLQFKFQFNDLEKHLGDVAFANLNKGKKLYEAQVKKYPNDNLKKPEILNYETYLKDDLEMITSIKEMIKLKQDYIGSKDPEILTHIKTNLIPKVYEKNQALYEHWLKQNQSKEFPIEEYKVTSFALNPKEGAKKANEIASRIKFPELRLTSFNEVSFRPSQEEQDTMITSWIKNTQDIGKFRELLPIYFNLLKRGEAWTLFVEKVSYQMIHQKLDEDLGYFQKKMLFYILLMSADTELRARLLHLYGNYNPIPLRYPAWPKLSLEEQNGNANNVELNYEMNVLSYFVTQPSLGILSLALGKNASLPIGKSTILNKVFQKNFSTDESSPFHASTIDIDFDCAFRPYRNFCIADAHGIFPNEKLTDFLSIFKVIIVHIHAEDLINSKVTDELKNLCSCMHKSPLKNYLNIFIRDHKTNKNFERDSMALMKEYPQLSIIGNSLQKDRFVIASLACIPKLNANQEKAVVQDIQQMIMNTLKSFKDDTTITKQKFLNYIVKDSVKQKEISEIDTLVTSFIQEMRKFKKDFFDKEVFPCRSYLSDLRNVHKLLRTAKKDEELSKAKSREHELNQSLKNATASKLILMFGQILKHSNCYLIITELSKEIKNEVLENIKELTFHRDNLLKELSSKEKKGNVEEEKKNEEGHSLNMSEKQEKLKQINDEIDKRSVSIEVFWRELMALYNYNEEQVTKVIGVDPVEKIEAFLERGEPFELIDGDNLQFNENLLKKLFARLKGKMCTISVLGPQSSGKSTLLNYLFGCQFMSSVGRCTRGIYLSILRIKNPQYQYLMILDTEGLQSVEKNDDEFDRKITLFCLAVSQIIIVNVKGDLHLPMKSLLEICTLSLHELNKAKINEPSVYFAFNQNPPTKDKSPFMTQISTMMKEILNANEEAKEVAEILYPSEENIHALGFAFQTLKEEKNENKGIWQDWQYTQPQSSFANECAAFGKIIDKRMLARSQASAKIGGQGILEEFSEWSDMAQEIWRTIDMFPNLLEFAQIRHMKQDRELRFHCNRILDDKKERLTGSKIIAEKTESIFKKDNRNTMKKLLLQNCEEICDEQAKILRDHYQIIMQEAGDRLMTIREKEKYDYDLTKRHEKLMLSRIDSYEQEALLLLRSDTLRFMLEAGKQKGLQGITEKINEFLVDPVVRKSKEAASAKFDEIWDDYIEKNLNGFLNLEEHDKSMWNTVYGVYTKYAKLPDVGEDTIKSLKNLISKKPNKRLSESEELQPLMRYIIEGGFKNEQKRFLADDQKDSIFLQDFQIKYRQPAKYFRLTQHYDLVLKIKYIDLTNFLETYVDWDRFRNRINYVLNSTSNDALGEGLLSLLSSLASFGILPIPYVVSAIIKIIDDWYVFSTRKSKLTEYMKQFKEYNTASTKSIFEVNGKPFISSEKEISDVTFLKKGVLQEVLIPLPACDQAKAEYENFIKTNPDYHIIGQFSVEYKPNKPKYKEGLDYCLDPYNRQIALTIALKDLRQLITETSDWEQLLKDIHENLMRDIEIKALNIPGSIGDGDDEEAYYKDISSFSVDLVKNVSKKVDLKITEYNKEILRWAYKLNMNGVGSIHLFSLLITWRTVCFASRKRLIAPIESINKEKEKWRNYFVSSVNNNSYDKSASFAERILTEYFSSLRQTVIDGTIKPNATQTLQIKSSEFDVIQIQRQIDESLLIPTSSSKDLIDYVLDQNKWIEVAFEKKWNENCGPLIEEQKRAFQTFMISSLRQIKESVTNLNNYLQLLCKKKEFLPFDVFEIRDLQNNIVIIQQNLQIEDLAHNNVDSELLEICGRAAFQFFQNYCTKGITKTWSYLEKQYTVSVRGLNENLNPVSPLNFIEKVGLNQNENQISFLSIFLESMNIILTKELEQLSKDELNWGLNTLGLDVIYQTFKNASIGCTERCPTCGRKCDRSGDDHLHACENGHQIRGMYGVQIGSTLSPRTCDEINPESELQIDNISRMKWKWKDFISKFQTWDFTKVDPNKSQQKVLAYRKCWESHGPEFCRYYSELYNQKISFSNVQEAQYYHFILALDGSGSMSGSPWQNAVQAASTFLLKLKQLENSFSGVAVSLIVFNGSAKTVASYKQVDTEIANSLVFPNGGTNFDAPLSHAYDLIQNDQKYDKYKF